MKIFVETQRLLLREILPTDIDGMFELDSDPEVHTYLGNQPVVNKDQSMEVINFIRQQYQEYGIGRWAIIDKNTKDFIGWTGLKFVTELTNQHSNYYDLGYRLCKRYWGKGIATEAALASLDYAFNTLELETVYAMAECQNQGSNKILKKVGLTFIEEFVIDGVAYNWYKINRPAIHKIKKEILDNICYTELVYARINKKLKTAYSKSEIELMLFNCIKESSVDNIEKKGKNYYIANLEQNMQVTINSFTYRVITVDRIN